MARQVLTFTPSNWRISQPIFVRGVDDAEPDGDIVYSIVAAPADSSDPAYSLFDPADVTVTNLDDDSSSKPGKGGPKRTLASGSESTAARLDTGSSGEARDDSTLVSLAAPLPSTATTSTSSSNLESADETTEQADAVDEALTDFDPGPLDDALLEDLAVALVG